MEGGEVGKDASKKGTTSANVVVQAFASTSSNLHTVAAGVPTPPGRQGAAMIQQQPCLATARRDAGQEKHREPSRRVRPR